MHTEPHVTRIDYDADNVVVLGPVGEIDLACVDILRESFLDALKDASQVVVDLSRTTFLDSTALGAIVAGGRHAQDAGGWVRLVAPVNNVRRVLQITRIDTVLGLYDTVEQAIVHGDPSDRPASEPETPQFA